MSEYQPGVTAPPLHVNCRSTTAPYFEDMQGIVERAARDKSGKVYDVPGSMTYKEWKAAAVDHENALKPTDANDKVENEIKMSQARKTLDTDQVEYREVHSHARELTEQEIIDRVGGGDETKGSCSSLALAYAGNKNGLDVLDFRGGRSREIFSQNRTIKELAELAGGKVVEEFNDYTAVKELLKSVVANKEYVLSAGKHTAIIRKFEAHFEYLELQSATNNGWFRLTGDALKKRFGCTKTHTIYGTKVQCNSELIDTDSLKDLDEFERLLGYINTAAESQMKGSRGRAK